MSGIRSVTRNCSIVVAASFPMTQLTCRGTWRDAAPRETSKAPPVRCSAWFGAEPPGHAARDGTAITSFFDSWTCAPLIGLTDTSGQGPLGALGRSVPVRQLPDTQ